MWYKERLDYMKIVNIFRQDIPILSLKTSCLHFRISLIKSFLVEMLTRNQWTEIKHNLQTMCKYVSLMATAGLSENKGKGEAFSFGDEVSTKQSSFEGHSETSFDPVYWKRLLYIEASKIYPKCLLQWKERHISCILYGIGSTADGHFFESPLVNLVGQFVV